MRKLSVLFAACLVMSMAFASVAGAQTVFPESNGSGETIGNGCPAGQFGAIPPNSLGEEGFACFDTQHEAAIYAETGEMPGDDAADDSASTQYADDDDVPALPDTGGTPLAALAAGLLAVWPRCSAAEAALHLVPDTQTAPTWPSLRRGPFADRDLIVISP